MLVFVLFGAMVAFADPKAPASPEDVLNVAKGFGTANLEAFNNGDPKISGRLDGAKYEVFFLGCTENKNCNNMQLTAGWALSESKKITLDKIDEWNRTKRFGKAFLDPKGNPRLEMDLPIVGVSTPYLERVFEWWQVGLRAFREHIQ